MSNFKILNFQIQRVPRRNGKTCRPYSAFEYKEKSSMNKRPKMVSRSKHLAAILCFEQKNHIFSKINDKS